MSPGSCAPMENSPPGIHTMPAVPDVGGRTVFGTVGRNATGMVLAGDDAAGDDVAGAGVTGVVVAGLERVILTARAATPVTITANTTPRFHAAVTPGRCDGDLSGVPRRLRLLTT